MRHATHFCGVNIDGFCVLQQYIGGIGTTIYAKTNADTQKRNAALQERKARRGKAPEVITETDKDKLAAEEREDR